MADVVRTEVNDGVLTITLDRPKANAIDVPTSGQQRCNQRAEELHVRFRTPGRKCRDS